MKLPQAIFLFLTSFFLFTSCHFFQTNPVILQIDSKEWTSKEFAHLLAQKINNLPKTNATFNNDFIDKIKQQLIQDLIIEEIIRHWSVQNNIMVSEQELQNYLEIHKNGYPESSVFTIHLKKRTLNEKQWKEDIKKILLSEKVMKHISKNSTKPSEKEMRNYYKNNKNLFRTRAKILILQIFHQQREVILQIQNQIQQGGDFKILSKKFSQSPSPGRPEWVEQGVLKVFDTAFSLKKGQFSSVLSSPYGYHLIQVLDTQPEETLSFSKARTKIQRQLTQIRQRAIFTDWLDKQSKKVHILTNQGILKKIKVKVQ